MVGVSLLPRCYLDDAGRDRCEEDDKVAHKTFAAAEAAVEQRKAYTRQRLRTYQGDCGYWHITSNVSE